MEIKSCLVCGMDIKESNISKEYKGETYFFCCEACKEDFNKDPEMYCDS